MTISEANLSMPLVYNKPLNSLKTALCAVLSLLVFSSPVWADSHSGHAMTNSPTVKLSPYGTLEDGTPVVKVTLNNGKGVEADVISYGGIITRLTTPDAKGNSGNIVLGLDSLEDYVEMNPYFGAIIGRYGNRIANGNFTLLGTEYQLAKNDGDNHLHGGVQGFDKKVWNVAPFVTENSAGVTLTLTSPDGDQGYPGELEVEVVYSLNANQELDMQFRATTDKATLVNLTQHTYFNLKGQGSILDHQLQIPAQQITPVGPGLIPTGELASVKGTPFDFTEFKAIGKDIEADDAQLRLGKGYDHNYVLKSEANDTLVTAAKVYEPSTGRTLEVLTEEPAVQFYSGNFLDGSTQSNGTAHEFRSGFCLEPQHNPDSPNQSEFPSTTLMPGELYSTRIVYTFGTK
ncbi:aldose epimerase family protein [Glaciecola sp. 1036]|uniref:aldose epimerase family protein n=1 Tax=Alteromonadaceae TaxID=72275 RepID=UPI003D02C233